MVACMFQVKRFYCEADYNFYNHLALTPQEYQRTPGGGVPWEIKSPGNVMNCPETNKKKLLIHPTPGGVPRGIGGGGSKCQKSGKFHELPRKSIHCCLPHPPTPTPTQLVGGGG